MPRVREQARFRKITHNAPPTDAETSRRCIMQARITVDPNQCGGRPCLRGLQIRVKDVLDLLAAGASRDEILADYPLLEASDIAAALEYAARSSDHPAAASGHLPPLRGKVAGEARRMRGVARSATASRSSAQFVITSRIRATASSVDAITSSFGNLRTRKP